MTNLHRGQIEHKKMNITNPAKGHWPQQIWEKYKIYKSQNQIFDHFLRPRAPLSIKLKKMFKGNICLREKEEELVNIILFILVVVRLLKA